MSKTSGFSDIFVVVVAVLVPWIGVLVGVFTQRFNQLPLFAMYGAMFAGIVFFCAAALRAAFPLVLFIRELPDPRRMAGVGGIMFAIGTVGAIRFLCF